MTSIKEKQEEAIFLENMDQNLPTLEQVLAEMELTEDTKCGFAFFQPNCLQKFASIKSFVLLFGLVGSVFSMTSSYFNGILTTLERRFQIPSRNIGIIMVGSDVATLFACWMISYYGGRKHRPRWLGLGLISIMLYCLLTSLPHFLYGPGLDALQLTEEYSQSGNVTNIGKYKPKQVLCAAEDSTCVEKDGHLIPQVIFFLAQVVSGFGDSIYWMLGSTYMDDNAAKSEAPFLLSLSFFTRMLGPVLGYNLASRCLRLFVAPFLTPLISSSDPRWIGAWWLGWIIIALVLIIPSICISCFPRELPKRAAKRLLETKKSGNTNVVPSDDKNETSFHDMKKTLIRLCKNKVFMYTNIASILFIIGFLPFWYFATKYIEIQFRVSPSVASMVNGSMGIVAAAAGVLISGAVISKFKPETKYLAAWNMTVGLLLALGFTIYINISCPENEAAIASSVKYMNDNLECSNSCHCDYVSYNPVCGEDSITYISPCHAGCDSVSKENGLNVYKDCSCIKTVSNSTGYANDGPCPIDCQQSFILFVVVCMFLNFIGSSSRASNFLVSVRCVDEKDKSASLGFHNTLLCLFAFIPIPIFAGWMFDKFCLVWGKTCEGKGNCWLYDSANLRFYICVFTIIFILLGTVCDFLVMINAKDIKCFDEKEEADCKT